MRQTGPQNFQFDQHGPLPISVSDRLSFDLSLAGAPLNRWAPDPRNSELRTEQDTSSGTEFDFTGIRADARRITIMFEGVSLTGTDRILVQLGDSVGFETSGYVSTGGRTATAGSAVSDSTTGYVIEVNSAASPMSCIMFLSLEDSANNTWISSHSGKRDSTNVLVGGGNKSVSDTLTQVRITRDGTDTFDSGAINILVEA